MKIRNEDKNWYEYLYLCITFYFPPKKNIKKQFGAIKLITEHAKI